MSDGTTQADKSGWKRPNVSRTGPVRSAGGFYRTSQSGRALGGVPLTTSEDAVVAAVRLAYDVAET